MYVVPDIIKFTYYHRTSIDYSVLCNINTGNEFNLMSAVIMFTAYIFQN